METATVERDESAPEEEFQNPEVELDPEEEPRNEGDLVLEAGEQLSLAVGGKRPTTSSLRLVGGKVDIAGQFQKGENVRVYLELAVTEVAFVDERDPKTRQITGCDRRHKARIVGIERA